MTRARPDVPLRILVLTPKTGSLTTRIFPVSRFMARYREVRMRRSRFSEQQIAFIVSGAQPPLFQGLIVRRLREVAPTSRASTRAERFAYGR